MIVDSCLAVRGFDALATTHYERFESSSMNIASLRRRRLAPSRSAIWREGSNGRQNDERLEVGCLSNRTLPGRGAADQSRGVAVFGPNADQ